MFLPGFFVSYLASRLIEYNGLFVFLFLALGFALAYHIFFRYTKRFLVLISLSAGLILGLLHEKSLPPLYKASFSKASASTTPINKNISGGGEKTFTRARIIEASAKSIVVKDLQEVTHTPLYRITGIGYHQSFFRKGDTVKLKCRFYETTASPFSVLESLRGIAGNCHTKEKPVLLEPKKPWRNLRDNLRGYFESKIPPYPSLQRGFLLADTSKIPEYEMALYRRMGIAHLFAASGLHLGILFGMVYLIFSWLRKEKTGWVLALIVSFIFLALLDFRISLLRAFSFVMLYFFLKQIGRNPSPYFILIAAAFISEMVQPASFFSIGFLLSFGVTFSIFFLYKGFYRLFESLAPKIQEHFAITFAAFSGSALFSVVFFGYTTPLSFLYNLILVPFAGVYLFISIVAMYLPFVSVITNYIDLFIRKISYFHDFAFDSRFSDHSFLFFIIWSALITVFLVFSARVSLKSYVWVYRKKFFALLALFISAYFIPFFWINHSQQDYEKIYPYGRAHYSQGNISYFGEVASFVQNKQSIFRFSCIARVYKIFIPEKMQKYANDYFAPWKINTYMGNAAEGKRNYERDLIMENGNCFLFSSIAKPERWGAKRFAKCKNLMIVLPKKYIKDKNDWKILPTLFGYQGESIKTSTFHNWQDSTGAKCK